MQDEINNWKKARAILRNHDKPSIQTARTLIPNQDKFIKESENKPLLWKPEQYSIKIDRFRSLTKKDIESQS